MFSRIREHFGTAGLVVAIVALVAALTGGAIAANGGSGGSGSDGKATASAKAKKGPRGPKGPTGDTGPAGPQGPAGPAGAKGDTGPAGTNGTNGAKGATGPTGPTGPKGTTGTAGAEGPEGSPWTAGGTLPSGETETGAWSAGPLPAGTQVAAFTAISFPIPLGPLAGVNSTVVPTGGPTPPECDDGIAPAANAENPEADPGRLCVFNGVSFDPAAEAKAVYAVHTKEGSLADLLDDKGATGAVVLYGTETEAPGSIGWGAWAVTAP